MVVRIVLGTAWALIVGLAGGWLMLSPWALGEQTSGKDWTSVTQTEFFTGLGLVVLAVVGLCVVAMQTLRGLRQAGMMSARKSGTSGPRSEASRGTAGGAP